ncbi:hypothetical protein K505DRAFT_300412 [Melanomma pulvis-pyrius CBS 109.77]|uniref:Uncharacterized protein n=1 Tax=Melanomma pulvis-pyrius CBS 109.77 TaxID=1314802 RepID=A0A6A6XJU1_9PLEO|nr:hypothetical protein K505DRAFT_300412 [Melanomma pulvis-pyrius CBS 109.77]
MRGIVKSIGAGVGLVNEAMAHHKEKKESKGKEAQPQDSQAQLEDDATDSDLEDDEIAWRLDEAAEAAEEQSLTKGDTEKKYEAEGEALPEYKVEGLVDSFVAHHPAPPPAYSPPNGKLSAPVVLPQKRPRNKGRGFVRAYAPMLAECGIDQQTFLEFLDGFDKSTHASQYLTVINGAAMVVGMVPEPIIMAVTISVQVAVGTAQELQSRHRTNTYLDKMNDALFRPHGLFCMLMTYKPDAQSSSEPVMTAGLISKTITPSDSKFKEQIKMFKLTTGKSKGEMELPEAAPLVYPALEKVMEQETKTFKSSSQFVADYMDRRSAAKYAYQHPTSKLNVPQEKKFASRYSDPNHPANSGSISALLTGGAVDLSKGKRERRQRIRDKRRQRRGLAPLTEEEKRRPKQTLIGRLLTQDVLYMMIVNMPTQEEMNHALAVAKGDI